VDTAREEMRCMNEDETTCGNVAIHESGRDENRWESQRTTTGDYDMGAIHEYTREGAIADGTLVDVSETGRRAGFPNPVAMTATVYDEYVKVPEGSTHQDETGRLRDILRALHMAIKTGADSEHGEGEDPLAFWLYVQDGKGDAEKVHLRAYFGPGDDDGPVITITRADGD